MSTGTETTTAADGFVERLGRLDSCAVSDALESLGLQGAALGIHAVSVERRVAGRVLTMELVEYAGVPTARHLGTAAIDAAETGDVIVVANAGRATTSGWGGVLSAGATMKGVAGVITDGGVRDVSQAKGYELPVYAAGVVPVTARGRVIEGAWGEPVTLCGVRVVSGDFVIADDSGVVFVPADRAEDVIAAAERIVAKEDLMAERALAGEPMVEVMGHDYESMLNGSIPDGEKQWRTP